MLASHEGRRGERELWGRRPLPPSDVSLSAECAHCITQPPPLLLLLCLFHSQPHHMLLVPPLLIHWLHFRVFSPVCISIFFLLLHLLYLHRLSSVQILLQSWPKILLLSAVWVSRREGGGVFFAISLNIQFPIAIFDASHFYF